MNRWCCLFLFFCCTLSAQTKDLRPKKSIRSSSKPFNLSICSLIKNEAKYLKEWIEYHLLVGVDHFYLYNIGSTDDFMKVMHPYLRKNLVTIIHWPQFMGSSEDEGTFKWSLGVQIPIHEHAIHFLAGGQTKWLVFLDIDEFLVSGKENNLSALLEKYNDYPGVSLACDCFDANAKKHSVPRRKLLIETLELTKAPEKKAAISVCKTIFKPDQCTGVLWPPYECVFKDERTPIALAKRELHINRYINRNEGYFFTSAKNKLHIDNRKLSEHEMNDLLALDYEIEDQDRVIYRFVPELMVRMGYDPTWGW